MYNQMFGFPHSFGNTSFLKVDPSRKIDENMRNVEVRARESFILLTRSRLWIQFVVFVLIAFSAKRMRHFCTKEPSLSVRLSLDRGLV